MIARHRGAPSRPAPDETGGAAAKSIFDAKVARLHQFAGKFSARSIPEGWLMPRNEKRPRNARKPDSAFPLPAVVVAFIATGLLILAAYQVYSGGGLKNVSIPGVVNIDFLETTRSAERSRSDAPTAPAPTGATSTASAPGTTTAAAPASVPERARTEPAPKPVEPARGLASRDFLVGSWHNDAAPWFGPLARTMTSEFRADDTCALNVVGVSGRPYAVACRWSFERLADDSFRLAITSENQSTRWATFRILDRERLHNIEHNYISMRIR